MNKKSYVVFGILLAILIGFAFYLYYASNSININPSPSPSASIRPISDLIKVTAPYPGQTIDINPISSAKSMVLVAGSARGNWFFEASFPVKILDANEKVLSEDVITASGDWMTTDFVPFAKEVVFSPPGTTTGTIVLHNDNPSGLPENSREMRIPIGFNFEATTVKVFFGNTKKDPGATDCKNVFPVDRVIPKVAEIGRASVEQLLKGPTEAEKAAGYYTSINEGVKINNVAINSAGLVKIDFDEALERAVGGSCRVAAISSQIIQTLKQFPTVKTVTISINGRTEDILQP